MSADDDDAPAIIRPPNKVKDKVTLGGTIEVTDDGFDPKLLAQAEQRAAGLRDVFVEAADMDLDRLQTACASAESDSANRDAHLVDVQRIAHEIKGYGTNIGYDLLTVIGDSLVTFLRESKAADDSRVAVARVHVDAMRLVFNQEMKGDGGENGGALLAGLKSTRDKFSAAKE